MVDRTVYAKDYTPDTALRQLFARQRLTQEVCKLLADSGLLSIEQFAMLGDTLQNAKLTVCSLIGGQES